ncbi:ctsa-2 [Pristionchus pacificus]|uniref:Carboxypeptidase n=1 Tax=Pristionchus pacificus TaxID=54126 RepID=A0A2A6BF79_PRIPA|nr:ctsa-2 [Pristionchus pacificus]|eukprot:PDM64542.1 ctsa-2 [Pristionchus pacificus]
MLRCLLFFIVFCRFSQAEPQEDLITEQLPKLKETLNFRQFAGYVDVSDQKSLFYWYTETQGDPEKDPVVLWLNGGPGCSSLQGLLLELGPLRVSDWGETVTVNPLSWNRFASIIFLDAPAGVGFSLRRDGLYNFTDDEVADDNHVAMAKWFEKFPERKSNDLYVMGESYAGTYIPMLAHRLAKDKKNFPQFKGMAVGNGCVNDQLLFNTVIQYTYYHGLTDETIYMNAVEKCCQDTSATDCDFYSHAFNETDPCYAEAQILGSANYFSGLDPYFLYFTCYLNEAPATPSRSQRDVMISHLRRKMTAKSGLDYERFDADPDHTDYDPTLPQCAHHDDYSIWLQLPELRSVLHVPDDVQNYTSCSQEVEDNYISTYDDMSETVKSVVASGVKVMFFNGDMDSICNVQHNNQFMARLGLERIHRAKPWNDKEQKPPSIGMWTAYKGLDFLTIRGAGHFASSDAEKPKESLQMFYNFIKGNDYSTAVPKPEVQSTTESVEVQTTSTVSPTTSVTSSVLNRWLFASLFALLFVNY